MAIEDHPVTALGTYDEPTWAETPTVAPVAPSAPIAAAGLGSVTLVSTLFNYLFRQPYRWIRALAHRTPRSDLGLIGSYVQTGGVYTTMGGTLSVALPLTEVWVEGVLIQLADALSSPHVFSASRDSYLFVESDGTRTDVEVGNGAAAPAGPGGTAVLVSKTVTDGTQVTASTRLLTNVVTLGAIAVDGLLSLGSDLDCNNFDVLDANEITAAGPITVTGDVASGSVTTATIGTTGNVSIGGNLDMTSGSIANATTIGATAITCTSVAASANVGGATISSSGAATLNSCGVTNALTVGTTLGVTGVLTATGGISLPSGADATGTSGTVFTGGTFDTIDASGAAKVGELQLYSDASPSSTTGVVQFFGRGLTVGLASTARKIAVPIDEYSATLTVTASSTATGPSISGVTLVTGDIIYITITADLFNTGTGTVIVFDVLVDGVAQNTPGNLRSDTAGVPISVARTVKYTAPGTANYTFALRYGATAGNTEGRNGFISIRQGN